MARVLVSVFGSAGDVHPFLAVGRALAARGHEVLVHANPHFERRIRGAGLGFVPLGSADEYARTVQDVRLMHRTGAARYLLHEVLPRYVPEQVAFVRDHRVPGETVVVASPVAVGAVLAGDLFDVPTAYVHLAPASMPSTRDPPTLRFLPRWLPRAVGPVVWWAADRMYDRWLGDTVNAIRAEHGRPPVHRMLTRYFFRTPQLRIGLFPEWFAPAPSDWPVPSELLGFTFQDSVTGGADAVLPPGLAEYVAAGDPPICVSMGTANAHAAATYRAALEAGEELGRRVLVLTTFPDALPGSLPDHAHHVPYAPFSQVLPHVSALVHHGGVGTTAQALRAGVPQLIVPRAFDQHDNAERVATFGCGRTVPESAITGGLLARELAALASDPDVASACAEVAARFADDPEGAGAIARAADLIEGLSPRVPAVAPVGAVRAGVA